MCIILQNCFIREGNIRAKEYAKCVFLAKSAHRIREKNHRIVNFVQGTLIAMDHVGAAFHRYRVKTAGIKGSSKVRSSSTLSIREKDTVCFHCANQVAVFPLAGVKNTWIGVPAIHEDISARIIREGANDVQGQ